MPYQLSYEDLHTHAYNYVWPRLLPDEYAIKYATWFADTYYGEYEELADHTSDDCVAKRNELYAQYSAELTEQNF